jgi:hypothetical protein
MADDEDGKPGRDEILKEGCCTTDNLCGYFYYGGLTQIAMVDTHCKPPI